MWINLMFQSPAATAAPSFKSVSGYDPHLFRQILEASCLLLGLFASLHLCSGKLMTPITDDVSKLSSLVRRLRSQTGDSFYHDRQIWDSKLSKTVLQKQNIPSDYEIPVNSIPKDMVRKNTAVRFGPT